ncbi:MAG: TonB-dependent receptor [Bacteroidales bacterium]|nr:TonB-dependent receptor [Bacteroidales bacterium]
MSRIIVTSVLFIFFTISAISQNRVTVSGYLRDSQTGEDLIGANIAILETGSGTITNQYGFYSISLSPGFYTLIYSYIGFQSVSKPLNFIEDSEIDIELKESAQEIEEVVITAEASNSNITSLETGATKLQMKTIRKIPALLGEVDVIKAIQLLPGVQVTSEGSSGFSVRGGSPDQNLILLDEATVYNASHLLGFFSVFNNDAIKDVKLYKGDIPARSGGRLASLLDVRMKDGNNKEISGAGGIGTISSRLTLEGPLFSQKGSFLVAGRRTYADVFLPLARDTAIRDNALYFYDLNGKINYTLNENNRFYLSAYNGKDIFSNDFAGISFGNSTFTFRWNHLFSKKLFSNFTLINSSYYYNLGTPDDAVPRFTWLSKLTDYSVKADFIYYPLPEHTFRFGASSTYHIISPGEIITQNGEGDNDTTTYSPNYTLESGSYLSGESRFGKAFSVRYGLRYSQFDNIGEAVFYEYDNNYQVVDSTEYDKREIFNTYRGLEPRLAANFKINEANSIKFSYSRTIQYLQLASNSSAGTPLDIWFPASPNIKPQLSNQYSAGYFRNFLDNKLESSIEIYYKQMDQSIDFAEHAQLILNRYLEGEVRTGTATSAGAELFFRYSDKKFSGWLSYTYSRTIREIKDVNNGNPYSAPYDKPNDLAVVGSYDINDRVNVSANWIYSSGLPYTLPVGRYSIEGNILPVYIGRNEYRLPDYHRLDISVTIKDKTRPKRPWSSEWNFSVYNAYARKNVWTLNFLQDDENPNITYAEMTYLFSIIPAITYNFKF